jgi:hypothetical protein
LIPTIICLFLIGKTDTYLYRRSCGPAKVFTTPNTPYKPFYAWRGHSIGHRSLVRNIEIRCSHLCPNLRRVCSRTRMSSTQIPRRIKRVGAERRRSLLSRPGTESSYRSLDRVDSGAEGLGTCNLRSGTGRGWWPDRRRLESSSLDASRRSNAQSCFANGIQNSRATLAQFSFSECARDRRLHERSVAE